MTSDHFVILLKLFLWAFVLLLAWRIFQVIRLFRQIRELQDKQRDAEKDKS